MYCFIDCNSFFVACERVFRPDLLQKPVIVLSNNDGCAVSRSDEAKPFIPMGGPEWKYRDALRSNDVSVFSANFSLYGDMSRRILEVVDQFASEYEAYSIDEVFINCKNMAIPNKATFIAEIEKRILAWTGIPVTAAFGSTKTLAKLGVEQRKRSYYQKAQQLEELPVDAVWGIGRRLAPRLAQFGVKTVGQLQQIRPEWARQFAGLTFMQTVSELQGIDCFCGGIQFNEPSKKTIAATRSFGERIYDRHVLDAAFVSFVTRATQRLRKHHRIASKLYVFAESSRFDTDHKRISAESTIVTPTNNTGALIQQALTAVNRVYDPEIGYKRAGIMFSDLTDADAQQMSLADIRSSESFEREDNLMKAFDAANNRFGKNSLQYANGMHSKWYSKREKTNPSYTLSFDSLVPIV